MIQLTTKQAEKLFQSTQLFMLLARAIEHEYWLHHKEYPLSSICNNHARRIRESSERIQLEAKFVLKVKNSEIVDDYVHEVVRLLKMFLAADTAQLKEFNDDLEKEINEASKAEAMQSL